MAEEPKEQPNINPFANQVVQIQIQPVDNGFLIQGVNIDGKNKSVRRIATDLEDLKKHIKELGGILYSSLEEPSSGPVRPEDTTGA